MKINSMTDRISIEASAATFESDLAGADSVRVAALLGLQRLRAARAKHAAGEQQRLAQELGSADPAVLELAAQVARDGELALLLGVEVDRVSARMPVIATDGWAVYGFVWNAQWEGQPNLTVAIYDVSGAWMRQFGYASTDDKGYFTLSAPGASTSTETTNTEETSRAFTASAPLVMHVINQTGTTVFIDQTALTLAPGTVEYRPIILAAVPPSGPPLGGISPEVASTELASAKVTKTQVARPIKKSSKKKK